MSIKISDLTPHQVPGATDETQLKQAAEQPSTPQESGKSSTSDTVSLSDNAVQLGRLGNSVASSPVVDAQRVEQVKQAIENGNYEVDPARVAEKLIKLDKLLSS